ncbi:cation:proton antiporter [Plectonema cf. radiosum LEGE 06105]|uniref:Cation:proton antiporter n=2 Tax=Plectonema TaxID=1183 RepID=A0A8J7JSU1_9CYAN|nr:cation:proton antiporter [Plectonema radiosum]MBE9212954.1 cation:proton antiporter [Plectonema cf. radiosum LEGE 06105]
MENFASISSTIWQSLIPSLNFSGLSAPIKDPVTVFLIIMAIMLVAPLLFERLRLPGIVGLIIAGVIIGPNGLGLLARDNTIILLGTVGLLFLMFMAGLETSLDDLKYNADKALIFGFATFAVPMVVGTVAMMLLGYNLLAAILVASCFASHTLLALPVVSKLGIMRTSVVTTTLGGTLITNVLALLVLAVVVKAHQGNLTLNFWLFLIPSLVIYTLAILWGVPKIGGWFFRRFGHDEGAEFIFVVATLFVASYIAQLIEIEPIIGAFLAGIGITQLIPQLSPLMNRIQFIGNTLFVPFFLISVGMLVNPWILLQEPQSLLVSGVMIFVAIIAKFIPAWGSGKLFGFNFAESMVMFGLSVAQAASTLAAITVAYQIELVDQLTVNGTIAMILVTCIASPWVTNRWGNKSKSQGTKSPNQDIQKESTGIKPNQLPRYRIVVPVANPHTEANLLQLALILVKKTGGTLLPLHIIVDHQGEILPSAKTQQQQLLDTAETIAHAAVAQVEPIGRLDDSIDKGILRTAFEHNANLIICGWKGFATYRDNFFGSAIDNVVRRSTIPLLITRFTHPIQTTKRVFLPILETDLTSLTFLRTLALSKILANELKASLRLLQVFPSRNFVTDLQIPEIVDIPKDQIQGNFVQGILKILQPDDLLILTHNGDSTIPGLPILGITTESIARNPKQISLIIFHFPRQISFLEDDATQLE